jgi:hypothetical protein
MLISLEERRRGVKTINHQQSGATFNQHENVHLENNGTNTTTNR